MSEKQKTITVLIAEFEENLLNVVNGSGLPASVVELVLGNMYQRVVQAAAAQLAKEKENEQEDKKE